MKKKILLTLAIFLLFSTTPLPSNMLGKETVVMAQTFKTSNLKLEQTTLNSKLTTKEVTKTRTKKRGVITGFLDFCTKTITDALNYIKRVFI